MTLVFNNQANASSSASPASFTKLFLLATALIFSLLLVSPSQAESKTKFRLAWSIYVGWMPWGYAVDKGIVKKWADKYGIEIEVVQINDYIESINQYTAGAFDACTMTNMDALTIPSAGGIDTTALIVGDYSDGNDGIILKGKDKTLKDIKGQQVNLVELSVSHYLLARALDSVGLSERNIKVVNTSDADMVSAFSSADVTAVTTWNPMLAEIDKMPDTSLVYDSSKIPGEIIDLTVANTKVLQANPNFGKALVGAWYETMYLMSRNNKVGMEARTHMAEASGTDLQGYNSQLSTTEMFYQPGDGVEFSNSAEIIKATQYVSEFYFKHGLLGEGAKSAEFIGIAFPNDKVYGDKNNIKLRYDDRFMRMAMDAAL